MIKANEQIYNSLSKFANFLIIVLLLIIILACGSSSSVAEQLNESDRIAQYISDYGGESEVYEEIFSLSDCSELQEKFDIAAANNDRETPGTAMFKLTLGYMTATDDRMREVGCYE